MRRETLGRRILGVGYLYGPVSAPGYASGYLLRKMGLAGAHDALLGAMVGCLAGALLFLATAAFNKDYRRAVRATFLRPNPWLIGAGMLSSFGQILYFATLFLSIALLRKSETLTPPIIVAATLGVAGTAFIIGL